MFQVDVQIVASADGSGVEVVTSGNHPDLHSRTYFGSQVLAEEWAANCRYMVQAYNAGEIPNFKIQGEPCLP